MSARRNGPPKEYPDPLSADGWRITSSRKLPTKRSLGKETYGSIYQEKLVQDLADTVQGVETQTECPWTSPLDMFSFTAQNASLKEQLSQKEVQVEELQSALSSKCCEIQILKQLVGI
ncbi:uncharacterized protein LOC128237552 [Mya arenaria]|uniref:uncharacterized protein LOC128237552 n=1 Tax=Mya arenaria TaxID=6604 RepID=UPI0022E8331B|nr:uncharacterized protein LOC128237552 [Mya arenaria]